MISRFEQPKGNFIVEEGLSHPSWWIMKHLLRKYEALADANSDISRYERSDICRFAASDIVH